MKRVIKSGTDISPREAGALKNVCRKAHQLLDAIEDLPTGTVDKLGDFGVVYEDIVDYLPAFHTSVFGEEEYY